ncbi:MAG: hypothetical protein JOY99_09385 [Sphingomonadaceae bacterium]|nr:hypothetical protein [Sphingomonadaceae bacterium]
MLLLFWIVLGTGPLAAQAPLGATIETPDQAIAEDAAQYAKRYGVTIDEAVRRLRAQEESVAVTTALAASFADRLAGIAIQHRPDFRIVVLLTGAEPVPDRTIVAGGMAVPISFHVGALATRAAIDAAMRAHQAELRAGYPIVHGMGLDMRTGELVLLVDRGRAQDYGFDRLRAELATLTGVPVRISPLDGPSVNLAVAGGGRVVGIDPADKRRYACTAGFVVRYESYMGVATAAHCPDQLDYVEPDGARVPLGYAGQWGARYQDVQIGVAPGPLAPLFLADAKRSEARPVTGARSRLATRAGDYVCHRGEGSGYSCAEIDLVDYAPPGDLCAGPCEPVWFAVDGPGCKSGDSGGPVFLGTTAFGIVKGETHGTNGACAGYFYMSTDYLPMGWSLATAPAIEVAPVVAAPTSSAPVAATGAATAGQGL